MKALAKFAHSPMGARENCGRTHPMLVGKCCAADWRERARPRVTPNTSSFTPTVLSAFLRLPSCRGEERCRCQHGRRWWCAEAGAWSQAAAECSKDIVGSLKITKQQYSLRDQPELLFCTRWRTLVVRAFLFSTVSRCTGSAAIRISVRTRSKGD